MQLTEKKRVTFTVNMCGWMTFTVNAQSIYTGTNVLYMQLNEEG
jgi:hypothetical protein